MPEGDPTATSDLEALRSVFDTNGDGKLTSADSTWSQALVMAMPIDDTTEDRLLDGLGDVRVETSSSAVDRTFELQTNHCNGCLQLLMGFIFSNIENKGVVSRCAF